MRKETIGAIVTTLNEEKDIGDCLRSLEWCDELLVVDSYSTDRTLEIVRGFPEARLEQRTYYGSAAQKNWAMDQCESDWILIFDADERCTPELRREIEGLFEDGVKYDSYRIRRRLFFLNRHIRFCGWHRDLVVRLVRSGTARYPNRRVHADMATTGAVAILKNPMEHDLIGGAARDIELHPATGFLGERPNVGRESENEVRILPKSPLFRKIEKGVHRGCRGSPNEEVLDIRETLEGLIESLSQRVEVQVEDVLVYYRRQCLQPDASDVVS